MSDKRYVIPVWSKLKGKYLCYCKPHCLLVQMFWGMQRQAEILYLGIAFWPKTHHTNKTSSPFCCLFLALSLSLSLSGSFFKLLFHVTLFLLCRLEMGHSEPASLFSGLVSRVHACEGKLSSRKLVPAKTQLPRMSGVPSLTESFHKPAPEEEEINRKRLLRFSC